MADKQVVYNFTANHTEVTKVTNILINEIRQTEEKVKTLKDRLAEAKEALAQMLVDGVSPSDKAFIELRNTASELERAIKDAGDSIEKFASRTQKLDSIVALASSIKTSFSSAEKALAFFGVSMEEVGRLTEQSKQAFEVLQGVQSVYNQMLKEGTIENTLYTKSLALMAKAKAAFNAVTASSSKVLRVFKIALASTGIGAVVLVMGLLTTVFFETKESIKKTVPQLESFKIVVGLAKKGIDLFKEALEKMRNVAAGVGNVLTQYIVRPLDGIIVAIRSIKAEDYSGALNALGNSMKKAMNVVENYQDGVNDRMKEKVNESLRAFLSANQQLLESIEESRKKKDDIITGCGGADTYKENLKAYLEAFESFQSETYKLQIENKQNEIDLAKESSGKMIALTREELTKRNEAIAESYDKQSELNKMLADAELVSLEQQYFTMLEAARKVKQDTADLEANYHERLNQLRIRANEEESALNEEKNSKLAESDARYNEESLQRRKETLNKELTMLDEHQARVDERMKDMKVRGKDDEGFLNVQKTKENYKKAGEELDKYLAEISASKERLTKYYDDLLLIHEEDSDDYKRIQEEKAKAIEKLEKKEKEITKRIGKNAKEGANIQKEALKEVIAAVEDYTTKAASSINGLFSAINGNLEFRLQEAQEKIDTISKKHSEMAEKVTESDTRLKELNEKAKTAQGGRLAVVQEQIGREMETRQALAAEEKRLAAEKEKAEKDKEKLEKQKKKNEIRKQIITAVSDTASGVSKAVSSSPLTFGMPWSAFVAAQGAIQIAIMTKQLAKLEDGGLLRGKRHSGGGMRIEGTNIEVEGGEYVVNRISTRKNMGLVNYINSQRRELAPADINGYFAASGAYASGGGFKTMFASGGQLPVEDAMNTYDSDPVLRAIEAINFQPVVSVVDIANVQQNLTQVTDWTNTGTF